MKIIFLLFLITIATLPVHFALNPVQDYDVMLTRIVGLILLSIVVVLCLLKKKCFLPMTLQMVFLIGFFVVSGLSLFLTEQTLWGIRKFIFFFTLIPFFFLTIYFVVEKWNQQAAIQKSIVFGSSIIAVIGIVQFSLQFFIGLDSALSLWRNGSTFFLGESLGAAVIEHNSWLVNIVGIDLFRVVAFFPDPHICAFFFGMTLPLALGLFVKTGRWLYVGAALLILIADLLTFSRGGYMGLIVGFIAFCILFFPQLRSWHKIAFGMSISILFFILMIPSNPVSQRLMSSFDLSEGSNAERFVNWQQASDVIIEYPYRGVGLGGYISHIDPRADYRTPIYAHNLYLDITAELGILGLLLWLSFLLSIVISFFRDHDNPLRIAGGISIVIFAAHSFFETPLFSVHIFTLLMIFAGLSYYKKEKSL